MFVDKSNFNEIFPQIKKDIEDCDFIAFDLEYSGIKLNNQNHYTLFDTMEDRYIHIRDGVKSFTSFQLGIVLFRRHVQINSILSNSSKFIAKVYNINLFPFGSDFYDSSFICSTAALRFLRSHDMNLNNIIDNGVPFLNKDEFNQLKTKLDNITLNEALTMDERRFLESQRKLVTEWLEKSDGKAVALKLEKRKGLHEYFHQLYLRSHFIQISTKISKNEVIVTKVTPLERSKLDQMEEEFDTRSNKFKYCVEMLGVTRIWKLISSLKKPIVGHNCLYDIVAIYQKFFDTLPDKFQYFRSDFNQLLPTVFDTKFIFGRMRMKYKEFTEIEGALEAIYKGLESRNLKNKDNGISIELYKEEYDSNIPSDSQTFQAHEAGYDAFITGCSLLYMANILFRGETNVNSPVANGDCSTTQMSSYSTNRTLINETNNNYYSPKRNTKIALPSFDVYEALLKPWKNYINVIRGHEFCFCLDNSSQDDGFRTASGSKLLDKRPTFLVVYDSDPSQELIACVDEEQHMMLDFEQNDAEDDNETNGKLPDANDEENKESADNNGEDVIQEETNQSDNNTKIYFCQGFLEQLLFEFGDSDIRKLDSNEDERYQKYLVAMGSYNSYRAFVRRANKKWPRLIIRPYNKWSDHYLYRHLLVGSGVLSSIAAFYSSYSLVSSAILPL